MCRQSAPLSAGAWLSAPVADAAKDRPRHEAGRRSHKAPCLGVRKVQRRSRPDRRRGGRRASAHAGEAQQAGVDGGRRGLRHPHARVLRAAVDLAAEAPVGGIGPAARRIVVVAPGRRHRGRWCVDDAGPPPTASTSEGSLCEQGTSGGACGRRAGARWGGGGRTKRRRLLLELRKQI